MYKHLRNVSRKFENISLPELEIIKYNLILVWKRGNEQTDRHTRNLKLFGTSVQISQECLQKISERYLIRNWRYPFSSLISEGIEPTIGLTDIQEICNYLEIVYKHLRNVSKKIQRDISLRTGDIPFWPISVRK